MKIYDSIPVNVLRVHIECLRDNANNALEELNQIEKSADKKTKQKHEDNLISFLKQVSRDETDLNSIDWERKD